MQNKIIPAIIPQSIPHLIESLEKIASFSESIQIDIVDGMLAPALSWPYREEASPIELKPIIDEFDVEVDLMIENPEEVLEEYIQAGVARVVIHLESTKRIEKVLALKNQYNFKLGFSISNDTDMSVLTEHIVHADYVQLMGIAQIGSQGRAFDERVFERIQTLRETYPDLEISIDGSVNSETLARLREAGAQRFVVGSAIMNAPSPEIAYTALTNL